MKGRCGREDRYHWIEHCMWCDRRMFWISLGLITLLTGPAIASRFL